MTSQIGLVGRSSEQTALQNLLDVVSGGLSGSLVLRGEPGVGKTALLNDAVAAAAEGFRVARVAGIESETRVGYAALYRLLAPFGPELEQLPSRHRTVLGAALGFDEGPPSTPYLVGMATLTLLAQAAEQQSLVCVIDDAQWLDQESREALAFVARRIYAERVGMLFAVREPTPEPQLEGIPDVRVDGLDVASGTELLLRLTQGQIDRQIAERLAREAEGNCLALTEIGRLSPAARMDSGLGLAGAVPVGERLERHYRRTVEQLPPDCRWLLLLAAAAQGDDPTLVWRGAQLEDIEPDALLPAEAAGLVELRPTMQFRHGLMRSAVLQTAQPEERRRVFALLGRLTERPEDADQRAWYLASAAFAPDEALAAELERHAKTAHRRGGYLAESAFLARSAELSPDPDERGRRYVGAAAAACTGGTHQRADVLLDSAAPLVRDPVEQARAALAWSRSNEQSPRPRSGVAAKLMEAAELVAPLDADLTREILLAALRFAIVSEDLLVGVSLEEVGRRTLALRPQDGDGEDVRDLLIEGLATLFGVGFVEAVPILRQAMTAMHAADALGDEVPQWWLLGTIVGDTLWDHEATLMCCRRAEELARQIGALLTLTTALQLRYFSAIWLGHVEQAQDWAAEGLQLAQALGWGEAIQALFTHPGLLGLRGNDDAARQAADRMGVAAVALGAGMVAGNGQTGLVLLQVARRDYEDAFTVATGLSQRGSHFNRNSALPVLVEAGARTGRRDEAAEALDDLAERATASGTVLARGILTRSRALLAPDDSAEPLYQEAIDILSSAPASLDLGRSHLLYGEWLRRQKRRTDARHQLRQAYDMFVELGIVSFADRARSELAADGYRVAAPTTTPKRSTGLTEQEENVARLAASGATNHEIATKLFISTHTVDYHLAKVFRKLGVRSRRKLADALATTPASTPASSAQPE